MRKTERSEYRPQEFEARLQQEWEAAGLYRANEGGGKPKFYCLDFFPYPSGDGLHVGHCRNYVPTDVLSRYKRMAGFNVLHPMGWDAFGEPTEQAAVRFGIHPRQTTDRNTANFRRTLEMIGASYDWNREIDSSKPEFYRWTQYFFLLLYKRGLAYRDTSRQWWCEDCATTLSSHEVAGGVCWRGHTRLTRRTVPAWYFRITAYADKLLAGLDDLDWPEAIKAMQRNWIGRSEGCEVVFTAAGDEKLAVFTTRPDTLFGVTFLALAPEHPLAERLAAPERRDAVQAYIEQSMRRSELDRLAETGEKSGVFTGSTAVHPLTGEAVPVWVADYVLPGYGTGAVMGVPAHDERDFEFARRYGLEVRFVVAPASPQEAGDQDGAYTPPGLMTAGGEFSGMSSEAGGRLIGEALQRRGLGGPRLQYRMRDWLISRQRYWGAPIPIIHCPTCGEVPVPEDQLPVELPYMDDFTPDGSGRSPLARIPDFVHTICPRCGGGAERETDTMGGFACSSWYFLRFTSPQTGDAPFDPQAMRYWMPVDLYVGGAEHAVLHLLYARFWTRVLADAGLVPFREPFAKLLNQGQMLGSDGARMSKSRGNVVTPDAVVERFGADALRVYVLFMAPFDQEIAWSTAGIQGARRFLNRVWALYSDGVPPAAKAGSDGGDPALRRRLHCAIREVEARILGFRGNTMISTLMEFVNLLYERRRIRRTDTADYRMALETLLLLLAPAAPFITEALWQRSGHRGSVHAQPWPRWDPELAREQQVVIPVQVDGRLRGRVQAAADADREAVCTLALAEDRVRDSLVGRKVVESIYVPGKILNILTQPGE